MNLNHLHYFYVVAKEGGFTKASIKLRIQQPAISRMVKTLEDDMGFKLFERIGRQVRLTSAGLEVFESCKKIFSEVEGLESQLGQISGECKGPLLIAASEPIASHFLAPVMKTFLRYYPKVYPNIYSGPSSFLHERIAKGELEFGLFFHMPELSDRLELVSTKNVRHYLVIRKDLRKKREIITTFVGSREIDDTKGRRFPTLDRLKRDYPEASIKISSNNQTAHKAFVQEGLGVTILPDFLVEAEIKAGILADLYPKEEFNFKMKLVKRTNAELSLNAKEFIKTCGLLKNSL